jgi:hypothetical protein
MSIYEEVQLAEMKWDADQQMYFWTCPCGDLFEISLEELHEGEDIALCPSCSLKLRVLFEEAELLPLPTPGGPGNAAVVQKPERALIASPVTELSSQVALVALGAPDEDE